MTEEEKKEYHRKYYQNNKEKMVEKSKKYRHEHYIKCKIHCETYRRKHKEALKKYHEENKEKLNKYSKEYVQKVSELFNSLNVPDIRDVLNHYKWLIKKNSSIPTFLSFEDYYTINKSDEYTIRSIMTRLGRGTINKEEALIESGQSFTDKDKEILDVYHASYVCPYRTAYLDYKLFVSKLLELGYKINDELVEFFKK